MAATFIPERHAQYRGNEPQIDYSGGYMTRHFPARQQAGALSDVTDDQSRSPETEWIRRS